MMDTKSFNYSQQHKIGYNVTIFYKKIWQIEKINVLLQKNYKYRKMKIIKNLLTISFVAAILVSCSSTKQVSYFQNIDQVDLSASKGLYDAKIMPKDELAILVSTTNPAAAEPFNLYSSRGGYGSGASSALSSNALGGGSYLVSYLVDNDGNINYPVFGKLHVVGLTKVQVQEMIEEKLRAYFTEEEHPIVTVRTSNYHVTVIGEVGGSRVINITSEKITILEALAQAGDLGIYGKRDNILIIRETVTGEKITHRLNLNDANIINDPFYYLQQNDVVYVEPNKVKAKSSDLGAATSMIFTVLGMAMSIATFVITLTKL